MARPKSAAGPQIYWQSQANQFVLDLDGHRYRLGVDPAAAEAERARLLADHAKSQHRPPAALYRVADACRDYLDSRTYPLRTGQGFRVVTSLRFVVDVFGKVPASDFDSLALQAVRDAMLQAHSRRAPFGPLSRNYVNSLIGCICTAWDWLGAQRLVPAANAIGLRLVKPIAEGFGGAEPDDILPASCEDVSAVLPFLSPVVAVMVRLQRLTGMRPGEVVIVRRQDITTSAAEILRPRNSPPVRAKEHDGVPVWFYAPARHKTQNKGKARIVAFGPEAQALLTPFFEGRQPDDYLFSPKESRRSWKGVAGQLSPGSRPGLRFTTQSYGRSIKYACIRASIPPWTPNQLRHAKASEAADIGDDALAADLLGHSSPSTTATYIKRLLGRLAAHAAAHG